MAQVNIHQAKAHLSKLIEQVIGGEEVIIARGNKPLIKLVLLDNLKQERQLGTAKGQITIADDFDEPLEDFQKYMP